MWWKRIIIRPNWIQRPHRLAQQSKIDQLAQNLIEDACLRFNFVIVPDPLRSLEHRHDSPFDDNENTSLRVAARRLDSWEMV